MVRISFWVLTALLGTVALGRAADEPEDPKSLAGKWTRAVVKADDGETEVVPRLTISAEGKTRLLLVGASHDLAGLYGISSTSYDLVLERGEKNLLVIEVDRKRVEIEYALDKDTLRISCKQKVRAGKHLKAFDISGEWRRVK